MLHQGQTEESLDYLYQSYQSSLSSKTLYHILSYLGRLPTSFKTQKYHGTSEFPEPYCYHKLAFNLSPD